MNRISCFAWVLAISAASAQEAQEKVKYGQLFPMPKAVLDNIKPGKDIPPYVRKTAQGLMIDKKHKRVFAMLGRKGLVISAADATAANEPAYQTFFKKRDEIPFPDGSMMCTYCTCGRNTLSAGDGCVIIMINFRANCVGYCAGENADKECSFLSVYYPPVPKAPSDVLIQ
jgi:hypothetical protein